MSKQLLDDSSDLPAPTDGEEKEASASGNNTDLLSFDEPEPPSDLKEHSEKPKSKKSKAKKLFKRAKSPISGAINKTRKEFEKLSNLPKHHHTSQKSPVKSPSRENLTEEYSKLEKKLHEKTSEEWLQFQQMQERVQQAVHKTKSTLVKYSSESEDNETSHSKNYSTKWTGFDDNSGLEPEVIDTSLNPKISITEHNETEFLDTSDLIDTGDENILIDTSDNSVLIDTSFIDTSPLSPSIVGTHTSSIMDDQLYEPVSSDTEAKIQNELQDAMIESPIKSPVNEPVANGASDDFAVLGLGQANTEQEQSGTNFANDDFDRFLGIDSSKENVVTSSSLQNESILSGYSFTSSMSNESSNQESIPTAAVDNDILMFEKPIDEILPAPSRPQPAPIPVVKAPAPPRPKNPPPFKASSPATPVVEVSPPAPAVVEAKPLAGDSEEPNPISATEAVTPDIDVEATVSEQVSQAPASDPVPVIRPPSRGDDDLFPLDDDETDATPVEPARDTPPPPQPVEPVKPMVPMFMEPLQPIAASPKPANKEADQGLSDFACLESKHSNPPATSMINEFASFDPIKSDSYSSSGFMQSNTSPVNVNVGGSNPMFAAASQPASMDIFSKIKMMSSGKEPVSPARTKVAEKPKDHFGFVKKALTGKEEEEPGYKPLAALTKQEKIQQKQQETENIPEAQSSSEVDANANSVNNPFMSQSFDNELAKINSSHAAQLFGLDSDPIDSGIEDFFAASSDSKAQNVDTDDVLCSENTKPSANTWVDPTATDIVDFGADFDTETTWEDSDIPKEKKETSCAWGGEHETALVEFETEKADNPFQDDFSKLEDVPVPQPKSQANPFISEPTAEAVSAANPFLDLGIEPTQTSDTQVDLLGGGPKPAVLSDSESFFFDSVADPAAPASDDIFDPFNVTAKSSTDPTKEGDQAGQQGDELDIFSSVAASGDKQLVKPADDDTGFKLDIKLTKIERPKADALPIAPALAPPPKAPKSPQPPRENPFDRESPPEENFAQFENKDMSKETKDVEKPEESPVSKLPTSMSVDSETTTEEEPENLEPLPPFLEEITQDTFKLMLRYPTKKKLAGNRYWKNVCVKLEKQKDGLMVRVLNDARDQLPIQELLLQPCYSLSDLTLQQYDQYGKIHTVKLQYVFYKERVGIKTERITPSIVKFKKRRENPKATMILDHSPQISELLKFGSLDKKEVMQFIHKLEDIFMHMECHREKTLTYNKDEVTAEVHDEYYAELDKEGRVITHKSRSRVFVLAFLTGMPVVEVGMNDRRRKGKEVVARCEIIPIKTEEWVRLENVEFHCSVDREEFEKTNNIKFRPLDACQFELMRYQVRLRENKELPLQLTIQQILKNRKCEVRCDLLVTGYHSYSKKHGQFPCEDIEVLFPIPEVWIYMFRYERRFGYGSVHSAARKPGKIKGSFIIKGS